MTLVKRVTVVLGAVLPLSNTWAQSPAAVAPGNYECWGNGSARMLLNFKVTGKDRYTDPDVKVRGSFIYNAGTGAITFKGGHLDGVMPNGFTSIYHEPKGRPTVSFRGRGGAEASFCERAGK